MNTLKVPRRWAGLCLLLPTLLQGQYQQLIGIEESITNTLLESPVRTADGGTLSYLRQDGERTLVRTDVSGALLWQDSVTIGEDDIFSLSVLVPKLDGGSYILHSGGVDNGVTRFLVMQLDEDGAMVWARRYSYTMVSISTGAAMVKGLACVDGGSYILVTAHYSNDPVVLVIRLDAQGEVQWARKAPYHHSSMAYFTSPHLAVGLDDGVFVYTQPSTFKVGLVSRFAANGDLLWCRSTRMTNASWDYSHMSIASDPSGGLYVFGHQKYPPGLQSTHFLLRLNEEGALDWYRWLGAGWFQFDIDSHVGRVGNDQVQFGGRRRVTAALDGTGVVRREYSFQSVPSGNNTITVAYNFPDSPHDDLLIGGALRRTDATFGYQWNHPVLMRVPLDLQDACLMDFTDEATADTLVPTAFLEHLVEPVWTSEVFTVSDATDVQVTALPLPAVSQLCTVVGVEEMATDAPLQVWPTLIPAGAPCQVVVERPATVRLLDALGRQVALFNTLATNHSVPTHALAPGGYLLQAVDAAGMPIGAQRVVVEY